MIIFVILTIVETLAVIGVIAKHIYDAEKEHAQEHDAEVYLDGYRHGKADRNTDALFEMLEEL